MLHNVDYQQLGFARNNILLYFSYNNQKFPAMPRQGSNDQEALQHQPQPKGRPFEGLLSIARTNLDAVAHAVSGYDSIQQMVNEKIQGMARAGSMTPQDWLDFASALESTIAQLRPSLDSIDLATEEDYQNFYKNLQESNTFKGSVNEHISRLAEQKALLSAELNYLMKDFNLQNAQRDFRKANEELHKQQGKVRSFTKILPAEQQSDVCLKVASRFAISLRSIKEHIMTKQEIVEWQEYPVDYAYKNSASQLEVFEQIQYLLDFALEGDKCCLIANGQSKSGKSQLMFGPKGSMEKLQIGEMSGIMHHMIHKAFNLVQQMKEQRKGQCQIRMEILQLSGADRNADTSNEGLDSQSQQSLHSFSKSSLQSRKGNFNKKQKDNENSEPKISRNVQILEDKQQALFLLKEWLKKRQTDNKSKNRQFNLSHLIVCFRFRGIDQTKQDGLLTFIELSGADQLEGQPPHEVDYIKNSLFYIGKYLKDLKRLKVNENHLLNKMKQPNENHQTISQQNLNSKEKNLSHSLFLRDHFILSPLREYLETAKVIVITTLSPQEKELTNTKRALKLVSQIAPPPL